MIRFILHFICRRLIDNLRLELAINELAQVTEKFDCVDFHVDRIEVYLELSCLREPLSILVGIVEELAKEMTHHMDDAD